MLENRIILTVALGSIIGIIMGLYCKISIVLFYCVFFLIVKMCNLKKQRKKFKMLSIKRYYRYLKIIFSKKAIKIIIISSILSNSMVLFQNYKYENLYEKFNDKDIICKCKVISNLQEKDYKNTYKVKVISINGVSRNFKNTNLLISINKNSKYYLKYGQEIDIKGKFIEPEVRRNYKGFNYKEYLKTLKIYGTVNVQSISIIKEKSINSVFILANELTLKIKDNIGKYFNENARNMIFGIILGDKSDIDKIIIENFSDSNISHILAVSGMHVTYVIFIFNMIFCNSIGKKYGNILTSFFILIYMFITVFSPSVVRAGISGIILILSENLKLRSDIWENLSISLIILLIYNPFLIENLSVILSYIGTIGIILLQKNLKDIWKKIIQKQEKRNIRKRKKYIEILLKIQKYKIWLKFEDAFILSISIYLILAPIMVKLFNKLTLLSLFLAIIVGFIVGPIVIIGILIILLSFTKIDFVIYTLVYIENFLIYLILKISNMGANMTFNNITLISPNLFEISFYYLILFNSIYYIKICSKERLNSSELRIKNLINLFKYKVRENKKKISFVIIIFIIVLVVLKFIPKNLKIFFVDVGQGDCTLIVTPKNKKILIDGGGSSNKDFDIGKKTLIPYLLDRRINKIDYIIISHFDNDHIRAEF